MATATDGLFAVNKPAGVSSAQVLRDLQHKFKQSTVFAEAVNREQGRRDRENEYQKSRRRQSKKQSLVKIGHGGTLDPMATGVLIAGVGLGTKRLGNLLDSTKEYEATAIFGVSTDTYDSVGKITKRTPYTHITAQAVEDVLWKFRGDILQRPPIYSALHLDGKRLYEYAREGKPLPVEIPKRPITISHLELIEFLPGDAHERGYPVSEAGEEEKRTLQAIEKLEQDEAGNLKGEVKVEMSKPGEDGEATASAATGDKRKLDETEAGEPAPAKKSKRNWEKSNGDAADRGKGRGLPEPDDSSTNFHEIMRPPVMRIKMTVSKGTYVRSLIHDIGEALGSSAIMIDLIRTRQGDYTVGKNVIEWEALEGTIDTWEPKILAALRESQESQEAQELQKAEREKEAQAYKDSI